MQHKSGFNKDDSDVNLSCITIGRASGFRYGFVVIVGMVVVLLGSVVVVYGVHPVCGSMALDASCSSPSRPIVGSSPIPTTTALKRSTPTVAPAVQPTATPTESPTFPVLTDKDQVTNDVGHYKELVLRKDFHKAYNLLDVSVRDQVSYDDFINNASYVLDNQCWLAGHLTGSQRADQTWDVSILMMQVSCADDSVQATFSWHFTVWMIDNLPEIMSVGLYPTGTSN